MAAFFWLTSLFATRGSKTMHELHELVQFESLTVVALQIGIFISVFQSFFIVQSWIGSLIVTGILLWITSGYMFATVIASSVLALATAALTVYLLKIEKETKLGFEVYYFIVQPFFLYKTIPLFVLQTKAAIGYPVAFIVWFGINTAIYYVEGKRFYTDMAFYLSSFIPIISILALGLVFYGDSFVAVGITLAIQAVTLLFVFKKSNLLGQEG
jgi:hypothetical protein